MSQEYVTADKRRAVEDIESVEIPSEALHTNVDDEEIADLLDEIDDVLEENAEQFVKAYVQKGGE